MRVCPNPSLGTRISKDGDTAHTLVEDSLDDILPPYRRERKRTIRQRAVGTNVND